MSDNEVALLKEHMTELTRSLVEAEADNKRLQTALLTEHERAIAATDAADAAAAAVGAAAERLSAALAARDRLQAVVDQLRAIAEDVVAGGNLDDDTYTEGNLSAWTFVLHTLRQLDVSEEGADG